MKLCDIQMLPSRIIDMENMADTLNAEDFLLEQLRGQIEDLERQVNITESTTLLSRHEKILGLPSDSEATLLDRRSRVVAKLLGQGTVTPKLVQYVSASFTNGAVDVTEYPEQYMVIRDVLDRFLDELPAETRKIFVRRYFYMSPVKEIADEYGLSESKVTVTLFRTRGKLKSVLEKEGITL